RNKLLGLWVAEKLGMSGNAAAAYATDVVTAKFEGPGGVLRKVTGDLAAKGLAADESDIRIRMDELMLLAIAELKAGK
ncbi:MAG: DUF1476 domain-containing protein, partial [Bradyrhizobium sp.]